MTVSWREVGPRRSAWPSFATGQVMTTPSSERDGFSVSATAPDPKSGAVPCRVAACVDTSAMGPKVIAHAAAMAKLLDAELTLIRVLDTRPMGGVPPDPVEWGIGGREAREAVEQIVAE